MSGAFIAALRNIFSPSLRRVLVLSLGLTLVLLAALAFGAQCMMESLPSPGWTWADTLLDILVNAALGIALIFLLPPVSVLFAGLFLDQVAAAVEKADYPSGAPGQGPAFWLSLWIALKFFFVIIVLNILALPLYFIPVFNVAIFWALNGYLLGREYFELVALRHESAESAKERRHRHRFRLYLAGLVMAFVASLPFLNILAPLFSTAFMVHLYKRTLSVS